MEKMKDTIYRQDAIDALDCINGTEEVLRSLPSAQPETHACDLIDRQAAIDYFVTGVSFPDEDGRPIEDSDELRKIWTKCFDGIPSAQPDTRSLEQIKWERDIAIQQLKDLGYSLGEKIRTDGDTISRQALMKEFSDFVRASNNSDFARTPTWNDAVSLVGSMPSAQPEQAAKGCRNCKYGKYNDHWKTHFCYNPNECTEWNLWEPSDQPDNKLYKIAELAEGTIDHFDLDDAMDLLYQIKEVLK